MRIFLCFYGDCNALNLAGCEPDASRLKIHLVRTAYTPILVVEPRIQSNDVFDRMDSSPKEVGQLRNEPISFEDRIALLIADTREISYFLVSLMSLFADSVGKSPMV